LLRKTKQQFLDDKNTKFLEEQIKTLNVEKQTKIFYKKTKFLALFKKKKN